MAESARPLSLAGLRAEGAHLADPVRFAFIEALARRSAAVGGEARQRLDARLAELLAAYAGQHGVAAPDAATPAAAPVGDAGAATARLASRPGPLAELLQHIHHHVAAPAPAAASGGAPEAARLSGDSQAGAPADLKALSQFRHTWSRLSVDQQLNRSLAKLPDNAGPLNSHRLVLRTLKVMNEVSPDHLQRYMSYVDALLWLDQASPVAPAASGEPTRAERGRKRRPSGRGRPG